MAELLKVSDSIERKVHKREKGREFVDESTIPVVMARLGGKK